MHGEESLRSWRRQPLTKQAARIDFALLAGGGVVFAGSTAMAHKRRVYGNEEAMFRKLNALPDRIRRPVWAIMQSGSLASVAATTGAALLARRPVTATGLGVSGFAMWGGAKVVKRRVQRGRPSARLGAVNIRGKEQSGLGFPSGHAAVATTLAIVAHPVLPPALQVAAWAAAGLTAMSRAYVGAHLPLDIVGGVALGGAVGGLTNLVLGDRCSTRPGSSASSPEA